MTSWSIAWAKASAPTSGEMTRIWSMAAEAAAGAEA